AGAAGAGGGAGAGAHADVPASASTMSKSTITRHRSRFTTTYPPCRACALECALVAFARTDPDRRVDWGNEDLPVSDIPGLGRAREHARYLVHEVVGYHDFHLDLREEVHRVLATSIELGVALFTAKTPPPRHRHSAP